MLLGRFGSRSDDDLGSKIDVDMDICNNLESMLSPAWEHVFLMDLGWFLMVWVGFEGF